jgi:hypothetical protein
VRAFNLPERVADWQPKLQHWAGLIASGRADDFKETVLLQDFLTDIFWGLLGYTGPAASADTFAFSRERHVEVYGKVADAVLGRFQKDKEQFVAVLEGKGARDPLDHPFAGRRMSAVDQAYRYAINLPCNWIIVTSMRETRLYHKGSPQNAYECFETIRLAGEPALLKRFVFLLGAERVVPEHRACHLYELLRASASVGRELTNQFYALYADIRQRVLSRLCCENSTIAPLIHQRPARISRLHRHADLEIPRVIPRAGQRRDLALGQLGSETLQADVGKTHRGHRPAECFKAGNSEQLSLRGGVCAKDVVESLCLLVSGDRCSHCSLASFSVPRLHPPRLVRAAR